MIECYSIDLIFLKEHRTRMRVHRTLVKMVELVKRFLAVVIDVYVKMDSLESSVIYPVVRMIDSSRITVAHVFTFNGILILDSGSSNICATNPCLNGGSCQPISTNVYRCACAASYTGNRCETSLRMLFSIRVHIVSNFYLDQGDTGSNVCNGNPCGSGGRCEAIPGGGFRCICNSGFVGNFCEFSSGTYIVIISLLFLTIEKENESLGEEEKCVFLFVLRWDISNTAVFKCLCKKSM